MQFEFATASRILFGAGTLSEIAALATPLGNSALIITGRRAERAAPLVELLRTGGISCQTFSLAGEPTVTDVNRGAEAARTGHFQFVVGFGGGAAIDAAKAVAAFATNPGDPYDHLEVVGRGFPLAQPPLPVVAIPTTAGTGAEVTRNAVLASEEHRAKVSLRSPLLLPRLAIVDPDLTLDLPPEVTASTGMDALTQLIEPFVSVRANPITDAICREGIPRAARSILRAFENGDDRAAREDMALASLLGGLALANSGLGVVHGFAAPIGGMFPAPHGAVCAALLPYVMGVNTQALIERSPGTPALERFGEIARMVTGDKGASIADGVRWVRNMSKRLSIPPLSNYGLTREHIPEVVEKAGRASSTKGNPIGLTEQELTSILEHAIEN
jgi:alcohol dehydrogenase class IV